MKNISDEDKIEYFDELFKNNFEFKSRFLQRLKLKRKIKKTYKNDNLKSLRDEIFDVFNSVDLESCFDNYEYGYDSYYNDFEEDVSADLLEIIFAEIEKRVDDCIKTRDFYQALFVLLATKKAIDLKPEISDDYGLIYDYDELLNGALYSLIDKCADWISNDEMPLSQQKKLISFLLENIKNEDELIIFEAAFFALINSKDMALFLAPNISKFYINIKLHILELLEDDVKYIELAKKFYKDNDVVASMLLQKLLEIATYEEYEMVAKECFEKNKSYFISDIFRNISYEKSKDFYLELLEYKIIHNHNLDDYKAYKGYVTQDKADSLLEKICNDWKYDFYIKILKYEKKYDKILELAQNEPDVNLKKVLEIIKSHYPKECLKIVTNKCDKLMSSMDRNREKYTKICHLLKIMNQVNAVKFDVNLYISKNIINRKPRLPAFLDELGKAGLM